MSDRAHVKQSDKMGRPDATHVRIMPAPAAPKVWGLTPAERLRRGLRGTGIVDVQEAGEPWPNDGTVVLLRGDVAYDQGILDGLLAKPGTAIVRPGDRGLRRVGAHVRHDHAGDAYGWLCGEGDKPGDVDVVSTDEVASTYRRSLRKKEPPYCLELTQQNVRAAEKRIYMGAYKGVTDLVTKYAWPVPAMWATRGCVALGFSPNLVTTIGAILMLAALVLFWEGAYGWGLLAGWIMTFLDTVDGKLARVTLTSSSFGNVFDHGIDLIHPPFWYVAWGIGLSAADAPLPPGWLTPTLVAIFGGYVVGRLLEGYFIRRFGFHIHVWRRFDSWFRLIVARRNPNLILLTAGWLAGRPDWGLLAVAIWTVAGVAVHIGQIAQAEFANARGRTLTSWLQAA